MIKLNGRTIGAGITLTSIVLAIVYLLLLYLGYGWPLIAVVVSIATFVVIGIIGWIGWTMATMPSLGSSEVGSETQPSEVERRGKPEGRPRKKKAI